MVKIRWLGHAAFRVEIANKVVLIDPFLKDNPKAAIKPEEVDRADIIVVTHDHPDHFGDTVEIAKNHDATVVGVYEVASKASNQGVAKTEGMNIGGPAKIDDLELVLTPAIHSGVSNPAGVIIIGEKTAVYHAGDTALFGDMKLISQVYRPRIALLPIGSYYTMGPREAALATSFIKPKVVIPMHYNTWPQIAQDPKEFESLVRRRVRGVKVSTINPGEEITV